MHPEGVLTIDINKKLFRMDYTVEELAYSESKFRFLFLDKGT